MATRLGAEFRRIAARVDVPSFSAMIAVFGVALSIFLSGRVVQIFDSTYALALSNEMLVYRSVSMSHLNLERWVPSSAPGIERHGYPSHFELIGGKLYYYFPNAPSLLSVPFVAGARLFGLAAVNPDGSHDLRGEARLQKILAAVLSATFVSLAYVVARLRLPITTSTVVAFGVGFGTSILSTTSRALWSDTWGVLLLLGAVWLLTSAELAGHAAAPITMATLLAWAYFCKPVYVVSGVGVASYLLIFHRGQFWRFALTGGVWFGLFLAYARSHYSTWLPTYFLPNRLGTDTFWEALAGNLVSPARGLLVFSPIVLFIGALTVIHWPNIQPKRLVVLAGLLSVVHLVLISSFSHWWGGHSYGPRLMVPILPWLIAAGVVALAGWRSDRSWNSGRTTLCRRDYILLVAGWLLLGLSVAIHVRGAYSLETAHWNALPNNIDDHPERLWDWRHPQALAGLVVPRDVPVPSPR